MNEDLKGVEWVNAKSRFLVERKLEPQIDKVVSQIVGRKIYTQDPRLIKLIIKWKKGKSEDSTEPDNFLHNENFLKELKETLNKSL